MRRKRKIMAKKPWTRTEGIVSYVHTQAIAASGSTKWPSRITPSSSSWLQRGTESCMGTSAAKLPEVRA
jgi:hypothetical protein